MLLIKLLKIFTQLLIFTLAGYVQNKLLDGKALHFTRVDGRCPGKNVPMQIFIQDIKSDIRLLFIGNKTVIVKENLTDKLQFTITVNKCRSRENLDTCEEFYKRENMDYCQFINPDNIVLARSPFAIPYTPPLKCPIKKGNYIARNVTINLTPIVLFNLDGWYWKLKAEIFPIKGNRLISCIHVELYTVINSRV